jgi:hypothetical protein
MSQSPKYSGVTYTIHAPFQLLLSQSSKYYWLASFHMIISYSPTHQWNLHRHSETLLRGNTLGVVVILILIWGAARNAKSSTIFCYITLRHLTGPMAHHLAFRHNKMRRYWKKRLHFRGRGDLKWAQFSKSCRTSPLKCDHLSMLGAR